MINSNQRQIKTENPPMRRRLKSTAMVLISQMLLIALAIAWLVHMAFIAAFGSISFVEDNPFILWGEIAASGLIVIFAIYVLVTQIKRLSERRGADRVPESSSVSSLGGTGHRGANSFPDRRQRPQNLSTSGKSPSPRKVVT